MTSLDRDLPVVVNLREKTNTQYDFLFFLNDCLQKGYLSSGDYLIMDNASVHVGEDTFTLIMNLAKIAGVTIYFLPAYSPELNPCENIFSFIKYDLRVNRPLNGDEGFWFQIANSISKLTPQLVEKYYHHCHTKFVEDLILN